MAFTRDNALSRLIQRFEGNESDLVALAKNFRALFLWAEAAKDIWLMRNQDGLPPTTEYPLGTLVVYKGDLYILKTVSGVTTWAKAGGDTGFVAIAKWGTD